MGLRRLTRTGVALAALGLVGPVPAQGLTVPGAPAIAPLHAAPITLPARTAQVEVNQASAAQLDGLRGVGPALSSRILDARAQAPFKDWADLQARVKGLGDASARRLSTQGLRVNGQALASH